ncbi:MAG TPA: hypothetical protein VFB20_11590 [Burkholderiales bacterium]|nr:hypothetical protein [Burkholderiales bacterium]
MSVSAAVTPSQPARQTLELSGPKLALALEILVSHSEEHGGIERYVEAVQLKSRLFREALADGGGRDLDLSTLKVLCAHVATARRRVGRYLEPSRFDRLREAVARLLAGREDTSGADRRMAEFCACFPDDRAHRWVRDLAAEFLHNVDPERYPLMSRWVWDARTNTGVLREIWHGPEVDHIVIDVPDRYETFLVLREELSRFLTTNGVYRDVTEYVDLLTAQLYAIYISEQGGNYLRADFATPEDPMQHTRRLLGLDGVAAGGRLRLKAVDGQAVVVEEAKLPD